jgi:ABC-type transporter Mla subunit MlaD
MNDIKGLLQSMLDPNSDFFKNFENQQTNQFNEQTLPNIAERFAGGAHGGALSSSGFGQALGGAASGLQSNLAAGKNDMILNALKQLLHQYNQETQNVLGAKPFDYQEKSGLGGGFMSGLDFNKLLSGLGQLGGNGNTSSYEGYGGNSNQYPLTAGYASQIRHQGY